MKYTATLAGYSWESGKDLIDAEVVLGSGDKTSSCKIVVSDHYNLIASALINHAISMGGIPALPSASSTSPTVGVSSTTVANTPTNKPVSGVVAGAVTALSGKAQPASKSTSGVTVSVGDGTASRGGIFDAKLRAFLDLIAYKEVPTDSILDIKGYYANNGNEPNFNSVPRFDDADIVAGGGFPKSARRKYNVGRYQFNRDDWDDAKKSGYPVTGYSAGEQDWVAVFKMQKQNKGWKELQAGDIEGAIKRAGIEWASLPGSPYGQVQAGYALPEAIAYYKKRLAYYTGGGSAGSSGAVSTPVKDSAVKPATPAATDTAKPVIKGSPIVVTIGDFSFSFIHQSTETNESGQTTITGQGVRWQMSRSKQSATYKAITLSQLAQQIAKKNKSTIDYKATFDPEYEHLDQSGISDYQLLLRECESNGLILTESKGKVVITDRKQIKKPALTIARGVNLISYKIQDKSYTGKEADISAIEPSKSRTVIDPITGKAIVSGGGGTSAPKVAGKTTTASQSARQKRIGGLPSTFVLPMDVSTLSLDPVSAVLTENISTELDRIWLVRKVTHSLTNNTTTIDVVSPVEVKETVAPAAPVVTPTTTTTKNSSSEGWIYPCNGQVTSLWNPRRPHPVTGKVKAHRGCDIANSLNTPCYAIRSGTVIANEYDSKGGGNFVWVQTEDGYTFAFLHLAVASSARVGQKVTQGEQIGLMGSTGVGTGVHLHVEIFKNRNNRPNPAEILPKLARTGNTIVAKEKA